MKPTRRRRPPMRRRETNQRSGGRTKAVPARSLQEPHRVLRTAGSEDAAETGDKSAAEPEADAVKSTGGNQ